MNATEPTLSLEDRLLVALGRRGHYSIGRFLVQLERRCDGRFWNAFDSEIVAHAEALADSLDPESAA